jgi:polar amino acid transport system substrate-binding protein
VPYYLSSQRILVRQDAAKISTLHDLIGKRVGVVANSGGAAVVETYNKNRGSPIRLFSSRDIKRMLSLLSDRQLDPMLLDDPVALWQMEKNLTLLLLWGSHFYKLLYWAIVNKDRESLYKVVNHAIAQIR